MALPTNTTALNHYYDDLLFTGAYLNGTKGLAAMGKKVLDARKKVQAAAAARNEKSDEVVFASVTQSIAWDGVAPPLESFALQASAYFDQDRDGYAKVFPFTPKAMLRASDNLRGELFAPALAFAKKSGLPGKLGPAGKAFLTVWYEYMVASDGAKSAAKAHAAAIAAVTLAKHQGVVAMRETEGALRTKYAENPAQWRRFFRSRPGKATEEKKPSPPAGGGTGEGPAEKEKKGKK